MTMRDEPIHPPSADLFAYRDGELLPDKRAVIEAHVMGCSVCRSFIDQVSSLESELRQSPDQAPSGYLAKLHESVRARIAAAAGMPAAGAGETGSAGEVSAAGSARRVPADWSGRERRGEDAAGTDEGVRSKAPRLPWAAVLSTASAAAAVMVVVVILLKQGIVPRVMPPRPSDAIRAPAESVVSRVTAGSVGEKDAASERRKAADQEPSDRFSQVGDLADRKSNENAPSAPSAAEKGLEPLREDQASQKREEGLVARQRAAEEPKPAGAPTLKMSLEPSTEYEALVSRFGLPPVWDGARVTPEALERVEPELRSLYVSGGAGQDSARIRLYLAEATRLRYAPGDTTMYHEIERHYRRAILLAGPDEETARVAEERLRSLER